MSQRLVVDGIDVLVEGEGEETIVMIHGWPDTHRLWDGQVEELKQRYRCVRFTLPGFDIDKPRRSYSLDATMRILLHIVNSVSQQQKVILMLHDWGCVFGYEFYMRNKSLVSAIIGVDVGDANSQATDRARSFGQKLMVSAYQGVLGFAWALGGPLGDAITRAMAGLMKVPSPKHLISSAMNYPYYILGAGRAGSYRSLLPFFPAVPMLYIYGMRKPFMFHSAPWTEKLAATKGCKVVPFNSGHWPMASAPEQFNQLVLGWLEKPTDEEKAADDNVAA